MITDQELTFGAINAMQSEFWGKPRKVCPSCNHCHHVDDEYICSYATDCDDRCVFGKWGGCVVNNAMYPGDDYDLVEP